MSNLTKVLLFKHGWRSMLYGANIMRVLRCSSSVAVHLPQLQRCGKTIGCKKLLPTSWKNSQNMDSSTKCLRQRTCVPSLRLFSTTTQYNYCKKTLADFQKLQPGLREPSNEIRDHLGGMDISHIITQDIRPAGEGEHEIVTPRVKEILRGVHHGNRAHLAEAITLVESKHPVKHKQAQWLLTKMLSHRNKLRQLGKLKPSLRVGISGPPGAGKSTTIEVFGQLLTQQGYKLAVLAVDPSSSRTGGSIMGDKTRMPKLSRDPNTYIRPSPSGGSLGGVTRSTNEVILLCEGAGYDIILVETVGVGQSEIAVCDMVDIFALIIPPAAGDELQGLKRGIVELADMVVINKADGDLLPAARRIKAEYVSALKLTRSKHGHWSPKVLKVSALLNQGIDEMWSTMLEFVEKMKSVGEFDEKRKTQRKSWLWNQVDTELRNRFRTHPGMHHHVVAMEKRVMAGSMAPGTAADVLLDKFFERIN